jgi:hypothetical protein
MIRCASCGKPHVPTRDGKCPRCGAAVKLTVRTARRTGGSGSSDSAGVEFLLSSIMFGFMGVTFYWLASYSGPYRTVSEWQTAMWGSYYPAVSIIALNLPVILALQAVRKVLGLGPAPRTRGEMFPIADARVRAYFLPALLFVFFVLLGASFTWTGVRAGDLRPVSADELLGGSVEDPVLYAELRGVPDERIVSIQEGGGTPVLYVPLHGSGGGEAVPAVIEVPENLVDVHVQSQGESGEVLVRGLAERNDVPGDVRAHLESQGVVLAEPCWLIRPKVDPRQRKTAGLVIAALGVVLGSVFYWVGRRSSSA